jgi:hypothetical protein
MKRNELLDKLEEIQERNYSTYIGINEGMLHTREEIADLFFEQLPIPAVSGSLPCSEIEKQVLEDYLDWCRNKYPGKQTTINDKMINDFVNGEKL